MKSEHFWLHRHVESASEMLQTPLLRNMEQPSLTRQLVINPRLV